MIQREKKRQKSSGGFTLVEVLAAFMIFIMVSQMMFLGISFTSKVETKAEKIELVRRKTGACLAEKSDCLSGTVRLMIGTDSNAIEDSGWLCTGEHGGISGQFYAVWVEEQEWNE